VSGEPPNAPGGQTTRSRYLGSRPFNDTEEDRARFFGRDAEGEQLYLRVLSVSLLVQFAASGVGKTSLLLASLFPRLRQKSFLPVMVRLNASEENLVDAVIRSFEEACKSQGLKLPELRRDGLWELLSTALVWRDGLLLTPVLVFDQFEEVFTLHSKVFRDELAQELGALATGVPPDRRGSQQTSLAERFGARPDVKIVISLREDSLGALEEFSPAIPHLFRERLRLEALSESAARDAIAKPAQLDAKEGEEPFWAPPFEFEPAAIEEKLAYLKGKSGVIEPFTLQLLCRHVEAIAHDKSERVQGAIRLAVADFAGARTFESVLKNFYRDALDKLLASVRGRAEELCEHGFLDREGRRLPLEEGQIYDRFGIDAQTLESLVQARVIRRERRLESVFYEITHDRLAESIFASRRNKVPKSELEQRRREQEQLHNEQQHRRKLQSLVHRLEAVSVVLAVVLGFAVWFYFAARSAQVEAQTQTAVATRERAAAQNAEVDAKKATTEAEKQRGTAEKLLGFMLGEKFLGEIRDAGRTSTLEKVRNQSEGQTNKTEGTAALVRGLALRNAGDIERNKGDLQESLKYFGKALDAIRAGPDTPDKEPEIARTLDRLGDASSASAQNEEALKNYQAEVEAWKRALETSPPDASDMAENCASLAQAMDNVADMESLMGQERLAFRELDDALQIVSSILFGARSSLEPCRLRGDKIEAYPSAKALQVLSQIAGTRADILNYKEDRESTAMIAEKAKHLMPYSISARKNAVLALSKRGHGLADYREMMREYSELLRIDPDNKLSLRDLAISQIWVSKEIVNCNKRKNGACVPMPPLEEAESTVLKAIATLNSLAQSDQQNRNLNADFAGALDVYAKALAKRGPGRSSECLRALKQSEEIYTALERDDEATSVENAAGFFEDKADVLKDLGRPDQSKDAMQKAIDRFRKLVGFHPDYEKYVDELADALGRETAIQQELGDKAGADALTKEKRVVESTIRVLDKENTEIYHDMVTHRDDGSDLLEKKQYEAAMKEFTAAEGKALEYMRHRPISSATFDNIRDIYGKIADAQEKLGNANEQGAALSASMHAAEIAAIVDPAKETGLYNARINLLRFYFFDNKRRDDAMVSTARQLVADVDSMAQNDRQNADNLWQLANANRALGDILHERNDRGWKEAIRIGIVDLEAAAKKATEYWKEAGAWRRTLADYLDDETPPAADDARHERQLAFADYQEAAKRDPKDKDVKNAIRELAVAAK
jgi:tetratricopeptide (TPR) repeat protein